jgi:hypothetical protein
MFNVLGITDQTDLLHTMSRTLGSKSASFPSGPVDLGDGRSSSERRGRSGLVVDPPAPPARSQEM